MSYSKRFTATAMVIFVFGIAMIDCAVAGEKMKWHGVVYDANREQVKVDDEEGHVLIVMKSKHIYFNDVTGERMTGWAASMVDVNIKTGQGFVQGYGALIDKDGDTWFRRHEGGPAEKSHWWKGTWTAVKGTGKYKGIKAKGTWREYSPPADRSYNYIEAEGDLKMP